MNCRGANSQSRGRRRGNLGTGAGREEEDQRDFRRAWRGHFLWHVVLFKAFERWEEGEGTGQRVSWFSRALEPGVEGVGLALRQVTAGAAGPRGVLRAREPQARLSGPPSQQQPHFSTGLCAQAHAAQEALKNVFILVSLKIIR